MKIKLLFCILFLSPALHGMQANQSSLPDYVETSTGRRPSATADRQVAALQNDVQAVSPELIKKLETAILTEDLDGIAAIIKANKHLLERADILARDMLNRKSLFGTPLLFAASNGKVKSVFKLIECGANVQTRDTSDNTFCHAVTYSNSSELIEYAWSLKQIQHLNESPNKYGSTPLMFAVLNGELEAVKTLIKHSAIITRRVVMHYAALSNNPDLIEYLWNLEQTKDLREVSVILGYTPLLNAAVNGKLDGVKTLIKLGAHVDAQSVNKGNVMHCAAFSNNPELIEYLWNLEQTQHLREVPAIYGHTPLLYAALKGKLEAVKYLLARVMCVAPRVFEYVSLEKLLDKKPRNQQANAVAAPLGVAAGGGCAAEQDDKAIDLDLIRLLIIRGAPVSDKAKQLAAAIDPQLAKDMDEWHAEYCASAEGYISIRHNKCTLTHDQYAATMLPELLPPESAQVFPPIGNNLMGTLSLVMAYMGLQLEKVKST